MGNNDKINIQDQFGGKRSKLDDILKNADRVVESVRQNLIKQTDNKNPLIETIDDTIMNNNKLVNMQQKQNSIKIVNQGVNAYSINSKCSLTVQIIQEEVFFDSCSFVSFEEPENLKKILALPNNLSLKGTVTFNEFLDHVNRVIKKNKNKCDHILSVGFIQDNNIVAQDKLKKLFAKKKVVPYIKYSMSSKLFIIPRTLFHNDQWSNIFNMSHQKQKLAAVNSEFVYLILFNKFKLGGEE